MVYPFLTLSPIGAYTFFMVPDHCASISKFSGEGEC